MAKSRTIVKPRSGPHSAEPRTAPARGRRGTPHGLRIAAIDIGTNSLHMVVVEVTESIGFKILSSEKDLTQLGSAALVRHVLTRSAMQHTLGVLGRYMRIARNLDCDRIRAYATSAVRESVNGGDFVLAAKTQLGLNIRVISSQEEARLIYLAVRQAVDLVDTTALMVDIGGGSAEFIVGDAQKSAMLESRKLGASRLTQQFIHHDPPTRGEIKEMEKHIHHELKGIVKRAKTLGPGKFIGTSGTMENLAAMCLAQHGQEVIRHRVLTEMRREDFSPLYRRLLHTDLKERHRLPGLDPGRADQIVAGAVLVNYLFKELTIPFIEVSDRAMREGMIIDYMQTHWPRIRLSVEITEPRRRSVVELGRRCNYDEAHHQQVARLALRLFDQLQPLHKLGREYRELLEFAALMHDVGWHIGHSGHHKHSLYLIKNGDLGGFSPRELEIMANVARYHRRSAPKKSHEDYMTLLPAERKIVDALAAILRIAEALDRGHYANVREIRTIRRSGTISIVITTQFDPELELWAARHKAEFFAALFHVRVNFSARMARAATRKRRVTTRTGAGT